MNKTLIILQREYITRVRKKSFLIMTIIGPILMAAMFVVPVWLAKMEDEELKTIAILDHSLKTDNIAYQDINGIFYNKIPESRYIKFEYLKNSSLDSIRKNFNDSKYYGVLYIPSNILNSNKVEFYSRKEPSIDVKIYLSESLSKEIQRIKLLKENINIEVLEKVKTDINVSTFVWNEEGKEKQGSTELSMAIGYISSFMIYMFIFLYGAQVMRGVIEEKTNRIVEVVVSSVKPFQLMMGKVIGVAMVGLTQFVLWVVLTAIIVFSAKAIITDKQQQMMKTQIAAQSIMQQETQTGKTMTATPQVQADKVSEMKEMFAWYDPVKFLTVIIAFLFYFVFGYLLYGSLFAAVGSAVDNETDTQQFMMPISIPLILSIIVMISGIKNPDGPIAFWFSIIPFTSPVMMMARIPFGVPWWQVFVSASLLLATFVATTWLAGKIYRVGILMYGKKVSWAELWKWINYKN